MRLFQYILVVFLFATGCSLKQTYDDPLAELVNFLNAHDQTKWYGSQITEYYATNPDFLERYGSATADERAEELFMLLFGASPDLFVDTKAAIRSVLRSKEDRAVQKAGKNLLQLLN